MSDPSNVAAHLPRLAAVQPDALAVAVARRDGAYATLTCAELDRRCDRIAHALEAVGIGEGVKTALMVPPSPAFFALTFALFKIRAIPVLIDPGVGLENLKRCLKDSAPTGFIGVPKAHAARLLLGWGRPSVATCVTVGPGLPFGGPTLAAIEAAAPDRPYPVPDTAPGRTAAVLFTSGATGPPKGAVYTHGAFAAQLALLRTVYGIEPGERDLATFPLFALFGPGLGMAAIVPRMDPSRPAAADPALLWRACADFACTNLFASPALIDKLGRWCEREGRDLRTLRRALSAGAPASVPSLRRFARLLGPGAQVHTPYGATEALPVASIGTEEVLADTAARTERGWGVCVGTAVPGLDVAVTPLTDEPLTGWTADLRLPPTSEAEAEAGVFRRGELVVAGPNVTTAYDNRPEADRLAKIPDPGAPGGVRHRMGDVGWIDWRGRIWMCGRKSERVETPDGTLFTVPCEAVFEVHPAVRRTALVGVAGRPVLCVELDRTAPAAADRRRVEDDLRRIAGEHAHTRAIDTFLFHPGFPVDSRHNAKILRNRLAVWAAR